MHTCASTTGRRQKKTHEQRLKDDKTMDACLVETPPNRWQYLPKKKEDAYSCDIVSHRSLVSNTRMSSSSTFQPTSPSSSRDISSLPVFFVISSICSPTHSHKSCLRHPPITSRAISADSAKCHQLATVHACCEYTFVSHIPHPSSLSTHTS